MKLNIGDKAPVFQGKDQDGNEVNLESFLGKKVVLYFYPNDDTPGCTTQSCNLRDNYNRFLANGYEVLGVSANDEESHRKFIAKYNLPFNLIADTDTSINEMYGVWVEKNMYGNVFMGTARTTFIIDENGYISDIIATTAIDKENHADQILGKTEVETSSTEESSSFESPTESNEPAEKKVAKPKAKKSAAKKAPAKKAAPKKKTTAKPAKKKAAAKKPAAKKAAPKKKVVAKKKTAAKKAVAKKKPVKATTKKKVVKKAAPKKKALAKKKPVAKKAAPKKKTAAKKKKK